MNTTIRLEHLTLSELTMLLGHLRLGEAHLKKRLTTQQFNNLLQLGALTLEQQTTISSNWAEKSGNVALVLNTVITSVFGASMGFSGFMSLKLNSFFILACITLIAIVVGAMVSYFSFKLTKQTANSAICNQKIHNLQLQILKLVIAKQRESLESTINYLNNSLNYIKQWTLLKKNNKTDNDKKMLFKFDINDDYQQWVKQLAKAIDDKLAIFRKNSIYNFYSERLLKITDDLYTIIMPNTTSSHLSKNIAADDENSFIKILSIPYNDSANLPSHKSWLQQNILSLLAGIIPTLLGGFASMFVFLAGGPNLAKDLGLIALEQTLRHPVSRGIELTIALSLTTYYGMSFVYNNYKMYVRQHEVVKTKQELILLEKDDVELAKKLSMLVKMKRQVVRIINIFTAVAAIAEEIKVPELISE